jgi:hypothetical protein
MTSIKTLWPAGFVLLKSKWPYGYVQLEKSLLQFQVMVNYMNLLFLYMTITSTHKINFRSRRWWSSVTGLRNVAWFRCDNETPYASLWSGYESMFWPSSVSKKKQVSQLKHILKRQRTYMRIVLSWFMEIEKLKIPNHRPSWSMDLHLLADSFALLSIKHWISWYNVTMKGRQN